MNWNAVAAVAETLGAIGVLASLVYLGTQIRQNTEWLRQQAFQMGTNEVRRWAAHFSESHANSELFLKGQRDFRALDPVERFRFSMMIFELCSVWGTYQQYSGDDFLGLRESAETMIETWIRQGWFEAWWNANLFLFPPTFASFVHELIARTARDARS